MSDYKESKDNPLHKDYGIWSNTKFIIKNIAKYKPVLLVIMAVGLICHPLVTYTWGVFGKFVIDIIQSDLGIKESVSRLIIVIAVGAAITALLNFGDTLFNSKAWYMFIYVRMHMITKRIARVLGLKYELLERPDVLDLAERAAQATGGNYNGVEGMMHRMSEIGESLFAVIASFIAVTILDWRLILALIVLSILEFLYFRWVIKKDKSMVWDKLSGTWRKTHYMERVTQDFDHAKDIRLFNLSGFLARKQEEIFRDRIKKFDYHHEIWFTNNLVSQFAFLVMRVLIYAALFFAIFKNGLSVGNFTMFLSLSIAFSQSLINVLQRFGDLKRASLETDDYRSFMELEIEDDEKDCIQIPEADGYEIEFVNVAYKYPKADKFALKNFSLKLHQGEKLAVVGLNGAGKTTMIKLLLRLYDPTEGYITLNGTDIRKFRREDYYRLFAPVFQNVEIFAFLMSENIAMRSERDLDHEKTVDSAAEAGLSEKLASLTRGVDTPLTNVVEDDGVDLSGGEKQKLALAKALYKGAKIIVLDEPTSALDAIAEQALYDKFGDMIGEKSAVYISHRLASTRFCDKVCMFAEGEMVEYGSHEELMEKGGRYAEMFSVQAQYYKEKPVGEEGVMPGAMIVNGGEAVE